MNYTFYFALLALLWLAIWSGGVWFFQNRRMRGPLFHRMTAAQRTLLLAGFLAIPCMYVFSYAPYMRIVDVTPSVRPTIGALDDLYVPAQWVFDHTALQGPLIRWAGIWSVAPEPLLAASASRMQSFWGSTPPFLYASAWLLIGIAWCLLPSYLLHRLLLWWQNRRDALALNTQATP